MRRLSLAVALVLVGSLTTSAWASCLADVGMQAPARMACCKDGHDQCPMHGTAEDCCKSEGQRHQQVSFATHEVLRSIISPPAIVATPVTISFVASVVRLSPSKCDRDVLKGPDPPPYLVGSAFLV